MSGTPPAPEPNARYTFGDTLPAGQRLALLAEVYADSCEDFLRSWAPRAPARALDLGCGPGHTTALLHRVLSPLRTTGIDTSQAFVEQARTCAQEGVDHLLADVTVAPLPVGEADVVYARFLLTHLTGPEQVLGLWGQALAPGGRLLVQENASMRSASPEFDRYYDIVRRMQLHHGQDMFIGLGLGDLARAAGLRVVRHGLRRLVLPARAMARLHLMNLRHWRDGEFARNHLDPGELDALETWLEAVAEGIENAEPVVQELGELVAER
ncbi:MAG: trans-aconitate 2-methyltransferase [Actinomycetota bacterium]|nr:trans-aconitate 2-methyltransferase [Actinomycetota bacterium]